MDLEANAERIASEAVELLSAPPLPAGTRTILLHPSQLYMQVHESCGHPTELDRAFGTEASYAGTSFLHARHAGQFRYGWDLCDIVADATVPGGLGTLRLGRRGRRRPAGAARQGGHVRRLPESRETAPRIGRQSGGAMRADGWNRIPLIRMTNVNLLPKDGMTLRRHRRRHRRRAAVRDQPQLVDRRPPPQLPVRDRGLPRDQGRQARASCTATAPTRGSRTSCGGRWTPSATQLAGRCGARRTAARASPARPGHVGPRRVRARGSATCGWGCVA